MSPTPLESSLECPPTAVAFRVAGNGRNNEPIQSAAGRLDKLPTLQAAWAGKNSPVTRSPQAAGKLGGGQRSQPNQHARGASAQHLGSQFGGIGRCTVECKGFFEAYGKALCGLAQVAGNFAASPSFGNDGQPTIGRPGSGGSHPSKQGFGFVDRPGHNSQQPGH